MEEENIGKKKKEIEKTKNKEETDKEIEENEMIEDFENQTRK